MHGVMENNNGSRFSETPYEAAERKYAETVARLKRQFHEDVKAAEDEFNDRVADLNKGGE